MQTKATENYEYLEATLEEAMPKVAYSKQTWQHRLACRPAWRLLCMSKNNVPSADIVCAELKCMFVGAGESNLFGEESP